MRTWTTEVWLDGMPAEVLGLLTEPQAIARWAPVQFDLLDLDTDRLEAGSHARVRGSLAGRQLEFDVEIREADDGRLSLRASGPISIDAHYEIAPAGSGSELRASVSVSGCGLIGGILARAVETLLAAGALRTALTRIGTELAAEPAIAL